MGSCGLVAGDRLAFIPSRRLAGPRSLSYLDQNQGGRAHELARTVAKQLVIAQVSSHWRTGMMKDACEGDVHEVAAAGGGIDLTRTQTIMQGAAYCDFRYRMVKAAR
jgi:hypothetical protein